jgi:hypothetical protein
MSASLSIFHPEPTRTMGLFHGLTNISETMDPLRTWLNILEGEPVNRNASHSENH